TGRYCWRGRLKKEVLWSGYYRSLIEKGRKTIGNMMKESGYATAHIGKWHLGWEDKEPVDYSKGYLGRGPKDLGFDYSFVTAAAHNLFPIVFVENHKLMSQLKPMDYFIYEPENKTPDYIYEWHKTHDIGPMMIATDWEPGQVDKIYTEKATDFITGHVKDNPDQPFYLHLTPDAPHYPNNVPDFMKGTSEAGIRGDHAQMFDWIVGEVMSTLDKLQITDNTLVIVTSDNGPRQVGIDGFKDSKYNGKFVTDFGHKSAGDLKGFKASLWEGGHRVPFIVHWPNKVKHAKVSDKLICLTDLFASFADLVDYKLDDSMAEDSFNALPVLLGKNKKVRGSIIHQDYNGNLSIRKGDWKLVEGKLYNMSSDYTEKKDLAGDYPQIVEELNQLLKKQVADNRTVIH
ncbi:MAG: sulfatase-like hydrolase/transferase, partial [Bacteroidota bacterium]